MMNIAFLITSTGWGGLEMNTLKLAKLMVEKGYEISLISKENSSIYQKGNTVFCNKLLLSKTRKYVDLGSAKQINRFLKKNNTSTILVFDNKDLDMVAWTKKLFFRNLKVVYQQHMQIGINKKDIIHTFRFNAIDVWISPLEYLKKEITHRTRFSANRIEVIPLCLDVNKFVNKKYSKQEARKALNLFPKAPLIGIIGRISEKKGQLFLIESLLQLKRQGHNLELLVFGSATVNSISCQNYYKDLQVFVKQNKLEDVVHFVPYQQDVALFYNAIDVFALASHSETYGMVTIEAMLSQLPVIATQSGGTSEILDYGNLGVLYEYGNHNDFCYKLLSMLQNKEQMKMIAQKAQHNALEKYSQEIEINAIDKLLKNL